jgi:hypothetical protein
LGSLIGRWCSRGETPLARLKLEAAAIQYGANWWGVDTDSERAIRWLIALMVAVL